ncbi:MAG TPA: penicillin-binding protein 2 [Streptosporangiaceae bacterium]|nr:penicillin-binding protein 2 [Streptosporangiaceae bacterium]
MSGARGRDNDDFGQRPRRARAVPGGSRGPAGPRAPGSPGRRAAGPGPGRAWAGEPYRHGPGQGRRYNSAAAKAGAPQRGRRGSGGQPGTGRVAHLPVPALRRGNPARRLRITLLCIAFALSIFAGRLVQLEGLDSAAYQTDSAHLLLRKILIPAIRGDITTSDGTVLAMTVQTYTVFADPVLMPVKSRPAAAAKLARLLGLSASAVMTMLNHPSSPQYQVLASEVPVTTASKVTQLELPGIDMTPSYTTEYPNAELASDIVGFTSSPAGGGSLSGAQGLENEYNPLLAGRAGSEEVEVGADNEPIPLTEVNLTAAVPARSLRLTIQADIQYEADQVCKQRVAETHARNCSIIVMDPKTGAILAMAQWPTYNPDDPVPYASTTNIGTANVFAPGSTLKPVTVAAALEQGGQTPLSAYTIPYQITMNGRYTFHDAELHPTVRYTIAGILAHSSNVGMVQVAQHITPQQQYDYLRAFGLGSGSGLGLTGESAGLLPSPGSAGYWADNRYEYAFGQGVGVTAMQMASIYATIANGGVRVQPTLVAGTTSSDGTYTPARPPAARRVIKAQTARELMTMLQQVPGVDAQAGESWGLISGYTVAAKTGTAQVSGSGQGTCLCQYGSSYIGIAPADNPQLVVAVNIQDPHGKYYGDEVAGPAFFEVMKFALQTMRIAPDYARTPHIRLTAP